MDSEKIVIRLAALAQPTRLAIFRLLIRNARTGMAAGEIAGKLKIPAATMSFHLKELSRAGMLQSRQEGRFVYYTPDLNAIHHLIAYLSDHCCADEKDADKPCR